MKTQTQEHEDFEEGLIVMEARDTHFQSVVQMAAERKDRSGVCEMIITCLAWIVVIIIPLF